MSRVRIHAVSASSDSEHLDHSTSVNVCAAVQATALLHKLRLCTHYATHRARHTTHLHMHALPILLTTQIETFSYMLHKRKLLLVSFMRVIHSVHH